MTRRKSVILTPLEKREAMTELKSNLQEQKTSLARALAQKNDLAKAFERENTSLDRVISKLRAEISKLEGESRRIEAEGV